jgi:hypothetical protein
LSLLQKRGLSSTVKIWLRLLCTNPANPGGGMKKGWSVVLLVLEKTALKQGIAHV